MKRFAAVAAVFPALFACTSVRMVQREGCWVKQTEKWPSRVSEELGFCSKPPPVWAQDRVARLQHIVQADRARAIELAIREARANDVVLIAGKGHENYQIFGQEKRHFSDVEQAQAAINSRG